MTVSTDITGLNCEGNIFIKKIIIKIIIHIYKKEYILIITNFQEMWVVSILLGMW